MSNDDQCIDYSLLDINYCEDTTQTMDRPDTLPAEDRHGITMRENVLTGLAKMATIVQKTEFQNQFFKKWMTDYWNEAKTPLNKNSSTIADLNLNSRAKSSSGSRSTNDSWSKRCDNYIHSKDESASSKEMKIRHQKHHRRQIIAVQRVNVLEQYILSHPELLNK